MASFVEKRSIYGNAASGRFGHTVLGLGDLDGDGFDDFAVGSPFEDEGRGAVRVFYGQARLENIQGLIKLL